MRNIPFREIHAGGLIKGLHLHAKPHIGAGFTGISRRDRQQLRNTLIHNALQKTAFYLVKGYLSEAKRLPFAS